MAIYLFPFAVCAVLAVLYQLRLLRVDRTIYGLALLAIGLFAGLRFETGQDWPAYEAFFQNLDTSQNPFDEDRSQFEMGYYLLNYAVKYLGGTYSIVLLLASLFCAYAVYRFTKRLAINRFYVLTIYVGYSFLILHFAQVRQSIAIAFFLLGCDYYLRHPKRLPALLIALIGPLFQFSTLMYVVLLLLVFWWPKRNRLLWGVFLTVVMATALYVVSHFSDFYSLLALLSSTSAEERIAVYRETQQAQEPALILFAGYLSLLVAYFARYEGYITAPERSFVVRYAIFSLVLTILFVVIFPGSYVMYSRGYLIACVFQGYAAALIFASQKGWVHRLVFVGTIAVALVYYMRTLSTNEGEYVPYHSILAAL